MTVKPTFHGRGEKLEYSDPERAEHLRVDRVVGTFFEKDEEFVVVWLGDAESFRVVSMTTGLTRS